MARLEPTAPAPCRSAIRGIAAVRVRALAFRRIRDLTAGHSEGRPMTQTSAGGWKFEGLLSGQRRPSRDCHLPHIRRWAGRSVHRRIRDMPVDRAEGREMTLFRPRVKFAMRAWEDDAPSLSMRVSKMDDSSSPARLATLLRAKSFQIADGSACS
jgi:hypothetical protein